MAAARLRCPFNSTAVIIHYMYSGSNKLEICVQTYHTYSCVLDGSQPYRINTVFQPLESRLLFSGKCDLYSFLWDDQYYEVYQKGRAYFEKDKSVTGPIKHYLGQSALYV